MRQDLGGVLSKWMLLISLFHSAICCAIFQIFNCTVKYEPFDRKFLVSDYSIRCSGPGYKAHKAYAIVCAVIYVTFPLCLFLVLWRPRRLAAGGEEQRKDPRLNIDLSSMFRTVRVKALGPDGKPLPDVTVWQWATDGSSGRGHGVQRSGQTVLFLPKAGGNVEVACEGYVSQKFPMLKKDIEVRLKKATRTRFEIADLPKLPVGLGLHCRLRTAAPSARRSSSTSTATPTCAPSTAR